MTFTAGQVLTAAQLNDLSITSLDVADGSVSLPSIANTGDLDTGIYWPAVNEIAMTAAGEQRFRIDTGGETVVRGTTGDVAELRIVNFDAAGDSALFFGDATDEVQAGFFYDESDQELEFRGHDNFTVFKLNANTQAVFTSGTVSAPVITQDTDLDTGFFFPGANRLALTLGGSTRMDWTLTETTFTEPMEGPNGSALNAAYGFSSDPDTGMSRVSADVLGLATAGAFRVQVDSGAWKPSTDNNRTTGTGSFRWSEVFAGNGTINTSDERLKTVEGPSLGLDFVRRLEPFTGRWLPGEGDDRFHQWLGAQSVAGVLDEVGLNPARQAMWRKLTHDDDGNPVADGTESLVYTELVPVLVTAVQELAETCEAQSGEIAELKDALNEVLG